MTYTLDGAMNFKGCTLDVLATVEFNLDGLLDIQEMWVRSDRRGYLVPASPRLVKKFQEEKWQWLYSECIRREA